MAKKQTKIIKAYKKRIGDLRFGNKPFILNIEELATVYHFPNMTVKAPLVKKVESKRSEPPAALPVDFALENEDSITVIVPEEKNVISPVAEYQPIKSEEEIKVIIDEPSEIKKQEPLAEEELPVVISQSDKGQPPTNLPF